MANHCVEVICSNCGAYWCARGCNMNFGEDKKFLEEWLKRHQDRTPVILKDEKCCEGHPVYIY